MVGAVKPVARLQRAIRDIIRLVYPHAKRGDQSQSGSWEGRRAYKAARASASSQTKPRHASGSEGCRGSRSNTPTTSAQRRTGAARNLPRRKANSPVRLAKASCTAKSAGTESQNEITNKTPRKRYCEVCKECAGKRQAAVSYQLSAVSERKELTTEARRLLRKR